MKATLHDDGKGWRAGFRPNNNNTAFYLSGYQSMSVLSVGFPLTAMHPAISFDRQAGVALKYAWYRLHALL